MTNTRKNKKTRHYSGLSGQAVPEGVLVRNRDLMAEVVRKPDQESEIEVDEHHGLLEGSIWTRIPLIRGILGWLDLLMVSLQGIAFSVDFYDEAARIARAQEQSGYAAQSSGESGRGAKFGAVMAAAVGILLATGLFFLLPYYVISLMEGYIRSRAFLVLMEVLIRVAVFVVVLLVFSNGKDIRRMRQYQAAEHKCINCIERGKPLTLHYVRDSSRYQQGCGVGCLILTVFLWVIIAFFIPGDSRLLRLLLRLVSFPVVAGVCYEWYLWIRKSDSFAAKVFAAPDRWLQHVTTREPEEAMLRAGIACVNAVFDWRAYLADEFGYDREELREYE